MHRVAGKSRVGRLFAVLLVVMLGGALVGVASSTQAAADESPVERVTYCQERGGAYIEAQATGKIIIEGKANTGRSKNIIPPFEGFAGKNWDAAGRRILANGCQIPAVPEQPAADVDVQPEGEVSCADNTRRDRTGTTTTEYVWHEDSWAWEPVTHETVWTDWTSTPLADSERLECAGPRPADTVVTRTKITESCDKNIVVTDYYDTWTRWTLSESNEWNSHVGTEVWDHKDTVKDAFTAEECGYETTVRDKLSWRCQEKTPTLVTDHYRQVYSWSPQQKTWVLGVEEWLGKDFRDMTADEQLEHGCVQPVTPAAPIWTDECGVADNGSWNYTDTDAYRYAVTDYSNGKVKIVASPRHGYVFPAGTTVQWQRLQNNSLCVTVPEQPTHHESQCVDHAATQPVVDLPADGDGVGYAFAHDTPNTNGFVVTATVAAGYRWGDLSGTRWQSKSDGSVVLHHRWEAAPDCNDYVTPVTPELTQPSCAGSEHVGGSINQPAASGQIAYLAKDGRLYAAIQQDVKAYTFFDLNALPAGWEAYDGKAQYLRYTPTFADGCPTEQAPAGTGDPVHIEFPAFDVFDAECRTGGYLVVVDTDEYSWDVNAHSGLARVDAAVGPSRTYGPGIYEVSAVARGGITFEDGTTRYAVGEVMVDGPDPGVCGYSDDEPTRPTKVLGSSLDLASAPDTSGQAPAARGATVPPAGTAPVETPAQMPAVRAPATQVAEAPVGEPLDPTPSGGMEPVAAPRSDGVVAAPVISAAPLAAGQGSGRSHPAARATDRGAEKAAPDDQASKVAAAAPNEVLPRAAGSDPAARGEEARQSPAPVSIGAAFVASGGSGASSGVTPYLVLAAGLYLMLMLGLRSRRRQD